jgi:hypothetical protein
LEGNDALTAMASERVFIPDNVDELEPSLVAFPDIIQTHGDLATCTQNRSLLHAFLNFSEADRAVVRPIFKPLEPSDTLLS